MKKLLSIICATFGISAFGAEFVIGKALIDSRNAGWTDSMTPYTDSNGGIWRFGLAPKGGSEPVQALAQTYDVETGEDQNIGIGYANQLNNFDVPGMVANNREGDARNVCGGIVNYQDVTCHPGYCDNPNSTANCCVAFELTVPTAGNYALHLVVADYGNGMNDGISAIVYTNGVERLKNAHISMEAGHYSWVTDDNFDLSAGDTVSLVIDPNDHYGYDTTAFEFRLRSTTTVADKATAYTLKHSEMADGMIDERIMRVITNHYMAVDADARWVDHFLNRTQCPAFFVNAGAAQRYEGFGKYIDAGALFSAYSGDIAVAEKTRHLLAALRETRDDDGYIGFWTNESDHHQEWMNWTVHDQEYILLAQLRCYLVFGDAEALEDAKIMAKYLMDYFPSQENGYEGITINNLTVSASNISTAGLPEAFLVLYDATGDEKYLKYAANIKHGNNATEIRYDSLLGWNQRITPDASDGRCHVYVMTARNYAQTELYREMGLDSLLTMSEREYTELFKRDGGGLLIPGSSSEGEFFSYTQNGTGHIQESCVTSYLMRWLDSLMRLKGDFSIGDVLERTMYNALFSANSADGRKIRYYTCFEGAREWDGNNDGFCCCGNFRRAIAELPQKIAYQTVDGTLVINFYTPIDTTFEVGEKSMALKVETDYPNSGVIDFTIGNATDIPLGLRIPRWCTGATYSINGGDAVSATREKNGLCTIERDWRAGDTVRLALPMKWRLVRGTKNQEGYVALMRGPQLFCLGAAKNAALGAGLNKSLMIDVESIGEIATDTATRSNGMMVTADAYTALDGDPASKVQVTFTEFADESGMTTYFRPYFTAAEPTIDIVYDELLDEGPAPAPGTIPDVMTSGYTERYDASQTLSFTAPKNGIYVLSVQTRDLFFANASADDNYAVCSLGGTDIIRWPYDGQGSIDRAFARYLRAGETVSCVFAGGEAGVLDAAVAFRAYLMYEAKDDCEGVVDFSEKYRDIVHNGGTTLPQSVDTAFGAVTLSAGVSRGQAILGNSLFALPCAYEGTTFSGFSRDGTTSVPWVLANDSEGISTDCALAGVTGFLMPHELLMHPGDGGVDTYLKVTVPQDGFYELAIAVRKLNADGDGVNGYIEIERPDDVNGKMTLAAQGYAPGGYGINVVSTAKPVYLSTKDAVHFTLNSYQTYGSDATGALVYLFKRGGSVFPGNRVIGIDIDGKQPNDGAPATYRETGFNDRTSGTFWNSLYGVEGEQSSYSLQNLKTANEEDTAVSMTITSDGGQKIGFDNLGNYGNALIDDYMYIVSYSVTLEFTGLLRNERYTLYAYGRHAHGQETVFKFGDVTKDASQAIAPPFTTEPVMVSFEDLVSDGDGKITGQLIGGPNAGVYYGFQLVGRFRPLKDTLAIVLR